MQLSFLKNLIYVFHATGHYNPCKETYEMLKEAVVGGQRLVFTRYHEVGVMHRRPHRFKHPREGKCIIGYDTNNVERHALRQGKRCPLPGLARRGGHAHQTPESWNVVWFCGGRNRDPENFVDEI